MLANFLRLSRITHVNRFLNVQMGIAMCWELFTDIQMLLQNDMYCDWPGYLSDKGSGRQWWTGNNKTPGRPYVLELIAIGVVLEIITLLNGAAWHTSLGGSNYLIKRVTIRSPNYKIAPNTDGLDTHAKNVLITELDITNGDDSICMKSPAENVLVENSVVRQGNGMVVGTSSDAYFW